MTRGKTFQVRAEHLELLRAAYVGWDDCEFGAPAIDPKCPYGDSDVERSIAKVLGMDTSEEVVEAKAADLRRLHGETKTALQVVLCTGKFEPGLYQQARAYCDLSWERVDAPEPDPFAEADATFLRAALAYAQAETETLRAQITADLGRAEGEWTEENALTRAAKRIAHLEALVPHLAGWVESGAQDLEKLEAKLAGAHRALGTALHALDDLRTLAANKAKLARMNAETRLQQP